MTRPLFLITNDDGIHAAGIQHLCQAVNSFADLAIVAPHAEKSGSGLAITWTKPLQIREVPWENAQIALSINGTPTDCVKMALSTLLPKPPQLILSGVNRGSNSGRTVLYSGTVGGVIDGVLRNIPGIAFSFSDFTFPPLGAVQQYIAAIVKHVLSHSLPPGTLLNVTFPEKCEQGVKGLRMARQGRGYWIEDPEKRLHPEGNPYYWLGGQWKTAVEDPDSDVSLLQAGYITAVPIHVADLTDLQALQEHGQAFQEISVI